MLGPRAGPVALARRLTRPVARRDVGLFLVEGPQAVREAHAAGALVELFATPAAAARHPELTAGVIVHLVEDRALAALAETLTPQGLVGVAPLLVRPVEALLAQPALVCVVVEPRDPGNLGTIIRTADAAGADAVVVVGDAVDVHNGKVVRAAAGSLWHLPVLHGKDLTAIAPQLRSRGLALVAAHGSSHRTLPMLEAAGRLGSPTAWVFGTEAHGLAADDLSVCDDAVAVPLHGGAESLNLATAAAVCLYASVRAQRWQNSPA